MTDRRKQTKQITISGRRKTDLNQATLNQHFADEIEALKKNDADTVERITRNHEEVMGFLRPISETYNTVSVLGKWMTAVAIFISIIIGIITGLQKILHR